MAQEYKPFIDRPTLVLDIKEPVQQVSSGHKHTLVLTNSGKVYGMGTNRKHEIGVGNTA